MRETDTQIVKFIRYFMRAYPTRSASTIGLLAVAGLLEGVGVAALLPVLELHADVGGQPSSGLGHAIAAGLGVLGVPPTLGALLAIVVLAMTAKALFIWLAMQQIGFTVAQVTTDLRMSLLRALLRVRWGYYASRSTGGFASAIGYEAQRASSAFAEGCAIIAGILQMSVYFAVALMVSWRMALATLVIGPTFLFLSRGFVRVSRQAGGAQTTHMRTLVGRLTDTLRGIKPIRTMGRETHLQAVLEADTEGLNQAVRRQVAASQTRRLFQEPTLVFLLALGLYLALSVGSQPFSSVMLLAIVFYRLMVHTNTLQGRYQLLAAGESAFWAIVDEVEHAERNQEIFHGTLPPPRITEGITLDRVRVAYEDGPVLQDLSLTIPAGSFTAIYGPSGAGKTTLADLVTGLLEPDSGEIYIDGIRLRDVDQLAWRRSIGYVPQESFLLHESILQNVTLGDDSLTRSDVEAALQAAGAWEFVKARAGGLDAVIGEAGSKLSGGQRQRISIARALVHKPRLLILDEATASLDPDTEAGILETLRQLTAGVTILAISHQATVRNYADMVISLSRPADASTDRRGARAEVVHG